MRAGRRAKKPDPRRIDAEGVRFAADELHAREHILHRFGEALGFGREAIGDSEHRNAARGEIRPQY